MKSTDDPDEPGKDGLESVATFCGGIDEHLAEVDVVEMPDM